MPESDLHPPAIMYKGPDGSKKWFVLLVSNPNMEFWLFSMRELRFFVIRYQGRSRSIDILEFVSTCMSAEVTLVDDVNYQSFLSDNEGLVSYL